MTSKNRNEKRRCQERTAARKRKERTAYPEKYRKHMDYGYVCFPGFVCRLVVWICFSQLAVFLLFIVSAFIGMLVFANFMSRCHFYLLLAEFPSMPCGIRIPVYFVNQAGIVTRMMYLKTWIRMRFLHIVVQSGLCWRIRVRIVGRGLFRASHFSFCCLFHFPVRAIFGHPMRIWGHFCVLFVSLRPYFCIFTTEKKYLLSTGRARRSLYLRFRVSVKARQSPGSRLL